MYYSLVPYVGRGVDRDAFRPNVEGTMLALDLRANEKAAGGLALVETPEAPPVQVIADSATASLSAAVRRRIGGMFGTTVEATSLAELLPELLLGRLRKPVAITRRGDQRVREIVLGELVWSQVIKGGPGAMFSESFDKPDSAVLGPDLTWTKVGGDWAVVSNAAEATGLDDSAVAIADGTLGTGDHKALATVLNNLGSPGPVVRASGNGSHYYWGRVNFDGTWQLYKTINWSSTLIGSLAGTVPATPFLLACEAEGSLIRLLHGTTVMVGPITDTSIDGLRRQAGIRSYSAGGRLDDFVAGDLAPPPLAAAVERRSEPIARADLLWGGQVRVSDLPVTDITVHVDGAAGTRRRLTCTMVDPGDLVPKNAGSKLAPYGSELAIHGGVWESGERTLHPGGVFRIDESSVVHNEGLTISLEGNDRSVSVDAGGFFRAVAIPPGANVIDEITLIVTRALPDVSLNFASGTWTVPVLLVWEEGESPWKACRELAASIGMEVFFAPDGTCVLRKVPNAWNSTPAASYVIGEDGVTELSRHFSAREGHNRYVVVGQDANRKPVRGDAWDDNPSSVTYYGGPFGKRWHPIIRDEKVGTTAQAQEAAQAWLNRDRGGTDEVELQALPDWQRDAGDVIRLRDSAIGLDELAVIEGLTQTHYGLRLRTAAKKTALEGGEVA